MDKKIDWQLITAAVIVGITVLLLRFTATKPSIAAENEAQRHVVLETQKTAPGRGCGPGEIRDAEALGALIRMGNLPESTPDDPYPQYNALRDFLREAEPCAAIDPRFPTRPGLMIIRLPFEDGYIYNASIVAESVYERLGKKADIRIYNRNGKRIARYWFGGHE